MKIQNWKIFIIFLTIGVFFTGNIQSGFSFTTEIYEHDIQTTEKMTSFDPFVEGWTYRKQITIDYTKVTSDLIDFPLLISITDIDLHTKAKSNGDDIVFMNDVGIATQLAHEIEYFDSNSGEFVAWVKVEYLSSSQNTILYMYYGNPTSSNQQNPEMVWSSTYISVWHMNDATELTISESTSNHYTGSKRAANEPIEKNGKIGKNQDFDGTDDYILCTQPIIPLGTKTISVWFKCYNANDWGVVLTSALGISSYDSGTAWELMDSGSMMNCYMGNGYYSEPSHFMRVFPTIPDLTSWHYYTMSYDGTTLKVYRDGILVDSSTLKTGSETDPTHNLRIGCSNSQSLPYPLDGELDEIRITDTPLSAAWVATEYTNQDNPSNFVNVGPEETLPYKTTVILGRITHLFIQGDIITFAVIRIRVFQLLPFETTLYHSNESVIVKKPYLGFITPNLAFTVCKAYLVTNPKN